MVTAEECSEQPGIVQLQLHNTSKKFACCEEA